MGLIADLLKIVFPAPEPIGGVRGGWGRRIVLRGRVVPRDTIESPLTGRRCVYYRYLVEDLRPTSTVALGVSAGRLWHAVEFDEAIAEFYLDDGTGRAIVEPRGAEVEWVAPLGPEGIAMPEGRRASELVIAAGALVEVEGVVDELADSLDGERGYREGATRLAVRAAEGRRLRIRIVGRSDERS